MARARLDIQESLLELSGADQRVAVLSDSVYFVVARVDVVVVPEADLYQCLILKNPVNPV